MHDARARGRLGRPDRQERGIGLPLRQAHARLAQAARFSRSRSSSSPAGPNRSRRGCTSARSCSAFTRAGISLYAGRVGTGFDDRELAKLIELLKPLETASEPPQQRAAHEREDPLGETLARGAGQVHRVDRRRQPPPPGVPGAEGRQEGGGCNTRGSGFRVQGSGFTVTVQGSPRTRNPEPGTLNPVIDQLRSLEDARKDGVLSLPGGASLKVTNLHKALLAEA